MKRINRLYRYLFPRTARAADLARAEKLRRDNRRMQQAAEQWQRCDAAARYLDEHVKYYD